MMKKSKKALGLLLLAIFTITNTCVLPAKAGSTTILTDKTSYQDELDSTVWNNPDGDVEAHGGVIEFSKASTDTSRLITQADVVRVEQCDKMFEAEFTLNFSALPENEKFVFGLGLSSIESMIGEMGNVELTFSNQNGLAAEVLVYENTDEATALANRVNCGSVQGNKKVYVELFTSGKLLVQVSGKTICEAQLPTTGEGSVGFLQSGSCAVKISDLQMKMYKYERPENTDIFEDFETDDFNANLLSSKLLYSTEYNPCTIGIEEVNGNKVFMFRNVGQGYLITKQQYSNFEMKFDLPYIQREEELNEAGEVVTPVNDSFGVSFGGEVGGNDTNINFDGAADLLLFMGSGVMGYKTNHAMQDAKTHLYGAAGCNKTATIKVTVIDAVVTVSVKWADEDDSAYETMLTYKLSGTPTGYIALWAPSGRSSTFAIDNLSIKNMDKDAKNIEVTRKSSKFEVPEDYKYEPTKKVYKQTSEKDNTVAWYIPVIGVAAVCILAIGVTKVSLSISDRRRKKGSENEKKL